MAIIQKIVLALSLLGIILFFFIPGYNDWLYVQEETRWSCITKNQWIWIFLSSSLLIVPFLFSQTTKIHKFIGTRSQWGRVFIGLNALWYALAVACTEWYQQRQSDVDGMSRSSTLSLLGGKAAWPALINLAMILIPVQRFLPLFNNQRGFGLSTKEAMIWHVWCGHAIVFWLLVHTILLSWDYFAAQSNYNWHWWWALMTPYYFPIYTEGDVNFAGWVSFLSLGGLWLASRPIVRRCHYELFYSLHVLLAVLFVVFANMHDYNTLFFIQPGLASWISDWYLRHNSRKRIQINVVRGEATESNTSQHQQQPEDEDISDNDDFDGHMIITGNDLSPVIRLCFPIPYSWPKLEPGMFVYLSKSHSKGSSCLYHIPHPFSISSVTRTTFTIHLKCLGDWTSSLIQNDMLPYLLSQDYSMTPTSSLFSFNIEGPYGGLALMGTLGAYSDRLFLAGGVGLAGIAALANRRQQDVLIWWVRTTAEARVLEGLIEGMQNVKVYVTREERDLRVTSPLLTRTLPIQSSTMSNKFLSLPQNEQQQQLVCIVSAILGMTLSLLLGRLLCCSYSFSTHDGQRYHSCSILTEISICVTCDSDTELLEEGGITCCSSPACYYCFRGAPILFSLLFTPICVYLGSYIVESMWFYWKQFDFHGRYSLFDGTGDADHLPEQHHVDPIEGTTGHGDDNGMTYTMQQDGVGTAAVEPGNNNGSGSSWHYGSVDMGCILSEHLRNNSAVVACGPESFVSSVQRETQRQEHSNNIRFFGLNGGWD